MLDLDSIELHDAQLKKMDINYISKEVMISLDYYENQNANTRQFGMIKFEGVISITQIADFQRLNEHFSAGNINYWVPAKVAGITYIYLSDGCLVINAENVKLI